jgi:hypothetical protein
MPVYLRWLLVTVVLLVILFFTLPFLIDGQVAILSCSIIVTAMATFGTYMNDNARTGW